MNVPNSRLIAVAPELLEALRECKAILAESAGDSFQQMRTLTDAELGKLWIATFQKVSALLARIDGTGAKP